MPPQQCKEVGEGSRKNKSERLVVAGMEAAGAVTCLETLIRAWQCTSLAELHCRQRKGNGRSASGIAPPQGSKYPRGCGRRQRQWQWEGNKGNVGNEGREREEGGKEEGPMGAWRRHSGRPEGPTLGCKGRFSAALAPSVQEQSGARNYHERIKGEKNPELAYIKQRPAGHFPRRCALHAGKSKIRQFQVRFVHKQHIFQLK